MNPQPEPWLRGPIAGVDPIAAPLLYALEQAREDLAAWTDGLSDADLWASPVEGIAPVGFHLRHIAGSVERLVTYLEGKQLSELQLAEVQREKEPGASRQELLACVEKGFERARAVVSAIDPKTWYDARAVGRKQLPTTVGGLVTHIAEHTQRHIGEAIITAKLVRSHKWLSRP